MHRNKLVLGLLGIFAACEGQVATPGEEGERAAQAACTGTAQAGRVTAAVNLRSAPSATATKVRWAPLPVGATVCLLPDASGRYVREGGEYNDGQGGTSKLWYQLTYAGSTGYAAAVFIALAPAPAGARKVVFYIQALTDPGLAASLKARSDVTIAVGPADLAALQSPELSYTDRNKLFLQIVGQRMSQVEALGESEIGLVVSGHSIGRTFFGDIGRLEAEGSLPALAAAHPGFAKNVRHLFLLGCNTAWPAWADRWRKPFPGTISVSGYAGTAPGGGPAYNYFAQSYAVVGGLGSCVPAGANVLFSLSHQSAASYQNWAFQVISRCASGTTADVYYDARKTIDLWHARDEYNLTAPTYKLYLEAKDPAYADPPADTQVLEDQGHPTPRRHYVAVQSYASAIESDPAAPASERSKLPALKAEIDQSIRLVFFRAVKRTWLDDTRAGPSGKSNQAALGEWLAKPGRMTALTAAFAAATGQTRSSIGATELGALDRRQTVRLVAELGARLPGDYFVWRLRQAFVTLSTTEIPAEYI